MKDCGSIMVALEDQKMISNKEVSFLTHLITDLGAEAERIKKSKLNHEIKGDGSPISDADRLINHELIKFISRTEYKNMISEENKQISFKQRNSWRFFWLIDPIDGTKEYLNKGDDYTINLALCMDNAPIFSVVYAPARQEFFSAEKGRGSYINDKKLKIKKSNNKSIKIVVSKSHLNTDTSQFIESLGKLYDIEVLQFGSSLKICKIAQGEADLYPRFGPTMEWDICASDLILREAGGVIVSLNNEEMTFNKESLLNPFFIAANHRKYIT